MNGNKGDTHRQEGTPTMTHQRPRGLIVALTLAFILGAFGTALAAQGAVTNWRQDDQREDDRITSDLASCQRGNDFRQQQIDIGLGTADAIEQGWDELAETFREAAQTEEGRARIDAARARQQPPIDALRDLVGKIRLTDCESAIPGAQEQP